MAYQPSLLNMENDSTIFETAIEENDTDLNAIFDSFGQAVVWGTDWTTETINSQLIKGNIDLNPKFQRRDAWSDIEKSQFIESLILGIPVPPIILAESKTKKNSFIVIDGKQRLLSIRKFYQKKQSETDEDKIFKPLPLKGLKILKDINNLYYDDIAKDNYEYLTSVDNQPIRTIVIKNWQNEDFLYTVFLRLNTGSKKLSPQELRQALHPGHFLDFLDDRTTKSPAFHKILNKKNKPDPRMKDIELALRFFSYHYFIEEYNGNLKDFLDTSCKKINENWEYHKLKINELFDNLEKTIHFTYELMSPDKAFCRYKNSQPNNSFNRAIFEIFTYYLCDDNIRTNLIIHKDEFVDKFKLLNKDVAFDSAVNDTTKSINRLMSRHNLFAELLEAMPCFSSKKFNKFRLNGNKIEIFQE